MPYWDSGSLISMLCAFSNSGAHSGLMVSLNVGVVMRVPSTCDFAAREEPWKEWNSRMRLSLVQKSRVRVGVVIFLSRLVSVSLYKMPKTVHSGR